MSPVYYERICPDCGRSVILHIKSKRCPECQAIRNKQTKREYMVRKRKGSSRIIGKMYPCENCGELYQLKSGLQRWCDKCADTMHKVVDRQLSRDWNRRFYTEPEHRKEKNSKRRKQEQIEHVCPVCGQSFLSNNNHDVYCSLECRIRGTKDINTSYEKNHREKRNEYHKEKIRAKIAAMAPDELEKYREETNRRARENYAKRKSRKMNN